MFEKIELLKLIVNILLLAPLAVLLFYRRFDEFFIFVAGWWLFSFFFVILHGLAVSHYIIEYIAHPLILVAMIAVIIANVAVIMLIIPRIMKDDE